MLRAPNSIWLRVFPWLKTVQAWLLIMLCVRSSCWGQLQGVEWAARGMNDGEVTCKTSVLRHTQTGSRRMQAVPIMASRTEQAGHLQDGTAQAAGGAGTIGGTMHPATEPSQPLLTWW